LICLEDGLDVVSVAEPFEFFLDSFHVWDEYKTERFLVSSYGCLFVSFELVEADKLLGISIEKQVPFKVVSFLESVLSVLA
jgi:hypothetical protein